MRGGRAGSDRVGPIRHERNRTWRCRPMPTRRSRTTKSHQAVSQDDIVQKRGSRTGRTLHRRPLRRHGEPRSVQGAWKSAAYEMGVQLDA